MSVQLIIGLQTERQISGYWHMQLVNGPAEGETDRWPMELVIGLVEEETDPWLLDHAVVHWTCRRRDRSTVTGLCSSSLDLQTERYIAGYWPMQFVIGPAEGEIDLWLLAHSVCYWTCRRRDISLVTGPCSWPLALSPASAMIIISGEEKETKNQQQQQRGTRKEKSKSLFQVRYSTLG